MKPKLGFLGLLVAFIVGTEGGTFGNSLDKASTTGRVGATAAGNSHAPTFSADGLHVAFVSHANNLVTNDDLAPHLDLFVRDLVASNTVLVSVSSNGVGGANDNVALYSLSSNAQFVACETAASNLVPGDTNRVSDIYVRDVIGGTTVLVSTTAVGFGSANGPSSNPLISQDGRYVVFESLASNLVTNDFNGTNDIFIRDLVAGTTTLVSVNAGGLASPTGPSFSPAISSSGLFVAFVSRATNLVDGVTNRAGEIFVHDVAGGSNLWAMASHLPGTHPRLPASGLPGPYSASEPVLSADGRYVAFKTSGQTVRFDLHRPTNSVFLAFTDNNSPNPSVNYFQFDDNPRVCASASEAPLAFTPEGRFLAYNTRTNIVPYPGIVKVDFESFQTNVAYSPPDGSSGGGSFLTNQGPVSEMIVTNFSLPNGQPSWVGLSTNGQRLFFLSDAPDLVSSATNQTFQFFAADVATRPIHLLSTNQTGAPGPNLEGVVPDVSPDGSLLVWDSPDAAVVADDANRAWDVFARDVDSGDTQLVSVRCSDLAESSERMIANLSSQALSANGRFLAYTVVDFEREMLPYPLDRPARTLFVRDVVAGTNILVGAAWPVLINTVLNTITNFSRPTNFAEQVSLNASGHYLSFSRETRFSGRSVFRVDLQLSRITLVGELPAGGNGGYANAPAISADGQQVAFTVTDNPIQLVSPFLYKGTLDPDIVIRNFRASGVTNRVVSINRTRTATGNGGSVQPQFSPDGRWLSFLSKATDLVAGTFPAGTFQVYVRDLERDQTRLVSFLEADETNVVAMSASATNPVFSAEARFVVFGASSAISKRIFRHDLTAALNGIHTNELVCADCASPSVSADGRFVAYQSWPAGGGVTNVVVRDLEGGQSELASVNRFGGAGGNGSSFTPLVSHDARYVVFSSKASDLVANDNNRAMDVFVRDRLNGVTHCLSRNRDGSGTGNSVSSHPILSADGRTVAFQSFAGDLIAGDYNDTRDVFVATLGGPDTDGDGMDDDWEMAYFNLLSRNGSGDFDGDGSSDLAEFRVGANPSKDTSVLRVITLTTFRDQPTTGQRTTSVIWTAIPGRTYRVQFMNTVDEGWTDLPGEVVAASTSGSMSHTTEDSADYRFYRVIAVP